MQLLKGLVLGLLVNRGFGQTDPLPTDDGAVDTVAEPVATDAPDPSVFEPSAPPPEESPVNTGGDTGDAPTVTIDEPAPSDARKPADEPTPEPTPEPTAVEDPPEPSDIPDEPVETPTADTEQPEPTDQPLSSEPEPAPTATDVGPTGTLDESPVETETNGENTQTNDQEVTQTEAEAGVIATEAPLNSAAEETSAAEVVPTTNGENTQTGDQDATQTEAEAPVIATEAPLNSVAAETPAEEVATSGGEAQTTGSDPDDVPATTASTSTTDPTHNYVVGPDTTGSEIKDVQTTTNTDPGEPTEIMTGGVETPTGTDNPAYVNTATETPENHRGPTTSKDNEKPQKTISGDSDAGGKAPDKATDKASATATGDSPGPTSEPENIPVQLEDSKLGDYAAFKDKDGETVLVFSPPPNGEATCDLPPTGGDDVPVGEYIRLILSVKLQQVGGSAVLKEDRTGSRLKVLVDKTQVYDQELVGTGGDLQTVSTEKFEAAKDQKIRMIQQSGDTPVELEIQDANLQLANSVKESGGDGKGGDGEKGGDDGKDSGGSKGGDDSGKDNGGKDGGGDSGSGSGSGSGDGDKGKDSGDGASSGGNGSGDGGSKGDSGGSGSGSGSGGNGDSSSGSGSASGTSDEDSSPSATAGSEGVVNAAGKLRMVSELFMYAMPLAAAFMW